jgi:hypothetical protein
MFVASAASGGKNPPVICGYNTGNHMLVNAVMGGSSDVGLAFTLTNSPFPANLDRKWKIKVKHL